MKKYDSDKEVEDGLLGLVHPLDLWRREEEGEWGRQLEEKLGIGLMLKDGGFGVLFIEWEVGFYGIVVK